MISDHPITAAVSILFVLLLAANRSLVDWWNLYCGFRHERKTRGTMRHRSMTPTFFLISLFGLAGHAVAEGPPVIVEIHAPAWCEPCKRIAPGVARLQSERFKIQQVDFDGTSEAIATPGQIAKQPGKVWANAFGVSTLPAFVAIDTATFKHTTRQDIFTEKDLRKFLRDVGARPEPKP